MAEKTYLVSELYARGLIGPAYCNCLDDFPMLGESGFCSFCEITAAIDKERLTQAKRVLAHTARKLSENETPPLCEKHSTPRLRVYLGSGRFEWMCETCLVDAPFPTDLPNYSEDEESGAQWLST